MPTSSSFDAIVVGAGVAGISIASLLSTTRRVVLLEREREPMYHSTSRSAALLIENYGGDVMEKFIRGSRPFLANPSSSFCEIPLLKKRGVLNLAALDDEDAFKEMCETFVGVEIFAPAELRQRFPTIHAEKFLGGVLEAGAMDLDVDLLCQSYLRYMKSNGGQLIVDAEVNSIKREGARWQVATRSDALSAPLLINAAGAWADEVARMAGAAPLDLAPHRRSAAIVEFEKKPDPHAPMMGDIAETWYAKPQGEWMLVSLADETPVPPCDIWPEDIDIAAGIDNFQQAVDMGDVVRLVRSWAGLRTFAPDRHPVVGFDTNVDGFFWLAGQGGSGIHAGPALAESAKSIITGDALPDWLNLDNEVIGSLSPARLSG